jgi:hypothetical protein
MNKNQTLTETVSGRYGQSDVTPSGGRGGGGVGMVFYFVIPYVFRRLLKRREQSIKVADFLAHGIPRAALRTVEYRLF